MSRYATLAQYHAARLDAGRVRELAEALPVCLEHLQQDYAAFIRFLTAIDRGE